MDEHHLVAAARYVERNPLRAGLCQSIEAWPWSSVNALLRGQDDELVRMRPLPDLIPDWRRFLAESDPETLPERIHLHARTGRPLGSGDFLDHLELRLHRSLRPRKRGPNSKHRDSDTGDMFSDLGET